MASEPKALFTIDAGKILAKLHLAAQQQAPNCVVINTGIKNPSGKQDPKDPGKVEFDFENKSGEYQACFGWTADNRYTYKVAIDPAKNKKLVKLLEDLAKAQGKKKDAADQKPDDKKTSLTDDTAKDKQDAADKKEEKLSPEVEKIQKQILAEYKSYGLKDYKEDSDSFTESQKSFNTAVKEENEARAEEAKKQQEKLKKSTFAEVKKYFETFVGKEAAAKVTESSLVPMALDADGKLKDPADFKHIKDYVIDTAALEKEIKSLEEKQAEQKPNEPIVRTVGFCTGYTVNID